jgi:hypothetical protein
MVKGKCLLKEADRKGPELLIQKKQTLRPPPQLRPDGHSGGTFIARSGGDALQIRDVPKGILQGGAAQYQVTTTEEQHQKNNLKRSSNLPVLPARSDMHKCLEGENSTPDVSWIDDIPMCPVFYPTLEEFEDPLSYIRSIAPLAQPYGKLPF